MSASGGTLQSPASGGQSSTPNHIEVIAQQTRRSIGQLDFQILVVLDVATLDENRHKTSLAGLRPLEVPVKSQRREVVLADGEDQKEFGHQAGTGRLSLPNRQGTVDRQTLTEDVGSKYDLGDIDGVVELLKQHLVFLGHAGALEAPTAIGIAADLVELGRGSITLRFA